MIPDGAGSEEAERLVKLRGLDRPIHEQYLIFLGDALQGDLGNSIKWQGRSAMELVLERLPKTLQLGGFAILVSTLIAIPIGVLAAMHKDTRFDAAGKIIALLGQAMPEFLARNCPDLDLRRKTSMATHFRAWGPATHDTSGNCDGMVLGCGANAVDAQLDVGST
ncbi:MAG: ABC transporter permease [Albidovulum sp.]|nr:ABC transporter permease [Albidovulum sp.]